MMQKNITYYPVLLLLAVVLFACCADDEQSDADTQPFLAFDVTEQPWEEESLLLTRATTDTERGLKDSSIGFELFCLDLNISNQQVKWRSESGLWDVEQKVLWLKKTASVDVYAYAPWESATALSDKKISFSCPSDNETDLLWASHENVSRNDGTANLTFRHALAKLSFGTITNNYGRDLTLTDISLTGFYPSGTLSLVDGEWTLGTEELQDISRTPTSPGLMVANGETRALGAASILQIPASVTITFKFTTTDFGTETATFNVSLAKGENKNLNLTITNNFEVVITNP